MKTYQFRIELKEFTPKIWRRISISSSKTLAELAYTIISSFNGVGSHLYNFSINGLRYGCGGDYSEPGDLDAAEYKIKDLMRPEHQYTFCYDFGDSWDFTVKVEAEVEDDISQPNILSGAGYGIVDDCGGTGGLEDLVLAYQMKFDEKYAELREWFGSDEFDIAKFDLAKQNDALQADIIRMKSAYEDEPF